MAEANCLAGCIGKYICTSLDLPGPAGEQADSFVPWCWIKLGDAEHEVTVGNESFRGDPNTACIKSMEIGWTNTPSMKCEIIDEAGGTLGVVADALRKCIKTEQNKGRSGVGASATFQFGWITARCESGRPNLIPSKIFNLIINQFEVSYSEGKIKYTLEGSAYDKLYEVSRGQRNKGNDDIPVDIVQAIDSLCAQDPACRVRYVELQPDGKLKDVKFEWARTKDPPKATWQSDNLTRLSTIMKWLGPFRVKDGKCDKGLVPFFNPDKPDELIILKDPQPGPGEPRQCAAPGAGNDAEWGPLGTFIVNGGKCSTVIEFVPTMNIINAITSFPVGGSTSGPNKSSNQIAEEKKCQVQKPQGDEAGLQLQATITQQAFDSYGTKAANDENLKSEIAHHRASLTSGIINPGVKAQLKILGNPSAKFCNFGANRSVSIVVINPFHIRNGGFCGDWLAYPGCNELFTNRQWMATSINHSITTGSYTTTLEVTLVAQDIQVTAGEPLGGTGSGGPVLANTCKEEKK